MRRASPTRSRQDPPKRWTAAGAGGAAAGAAVLGSGGPYAAGLLCTPRDGVTCGA